MSSPRYRVIETAGIIRANYPALHGRTLERLAFEFAAAPNVETYCSMLEWIDANKSIAPDLVRRMTFNAEKALTV